MRDITFLLCILFVIIVLSKSVSSAHNQGERVIPRYQFQEARILAKDIFKKKKKLFTHLSIQLLQVLVAVCGIFSCGTQTPRCTLWDLVP